MHKNSEIQIPCAGSICFGELVRSKWSDPWDSGSADEKKKKIQPNMFLKIEAENLRMEKTFSDKNKHHVHLFSPFLVVTTTLLLGWFMCWVSGLSADISSDR